MLGLERLATAAPSAARHNFNRLMKVPLPPVQRVVVGVSLTSGGT
jgi:hypothetical protein